MYVLSSNFRSFSFSLPSAEVQSPSSRSCTFRVGPDVIGTSYWQAGNTRMQRQTAMPNPERRQIKFDKVTARVRERAQLRRQLFGELRRNHVNLLDRRRFRQKFAGFLHQRLRYLATQMRVAARVICERVKDAVRGRSDFNCKP